MSVKREPISALFDHQGCGSRGQVFFMQSPGFGAGHSDGRLSKRRVGEQLKRVTKGADAQLRVICRHGVVPS